MRQCIPALLAAFLMMPAFGFAQKASKIHSPAELFEILDKSKIAYELDILDSSFACIDRTDNLNHNWAFPSSSEDARNGFETYKLKDAEKALLKEAEDLFEKDQYEAARQKYLELTKLRPDFAPAFTYIGQTYEKFDQYSEAIKYEEQAIQANYYDYLAHYFLADNYAMIGNHKRATEEIILASILNRNNQNIRRAMQRILPAAGYRAPQWCFEPQVLITRKDDKHISLKTAVNWSGWALAKAAWKFEPGYRQASGGAPEGQYNMAEDKECLACLAFMVSNDTGTSWKGQPELVALRKAFEGDMFHEYLLYEVVLPKFPMAVYQMPKAQLEDIRKYFMKARVL
jgi:tetratricopeptide (TPR) repeat protein